MKNRMKKMISLTMVIILLLAALAGCGDAMYGNGEATPSINAGAQPEDLGTENKKDTDPTRVFTLDSLEPLSKEKQKEVEDAWKKVEGNIELQWVAEDTDHWRRFGDRYYGTYNGCIVIFGIGSLDDDKIIEVAGYKITHKYVAAMWVYSNGEFYRIEVAYEKGLLSEADIAAIVEYHNKYQAYIESITPTPEDIVFTLEPLEPLSKEKQVEIEKAWEKEHDGTGVLQWCYAGEDSWLLWGDKYYGSYGNSIIIFYKKGNIGQSHTIEVAGETFDYYNRFEIYVYNEGVFYTIKEAYEKGILSKENIGNIAEYHKGFLVYISEKLYS